MCAFIALENFIAKGSVHKVFIVILHTMQVTQAMNLLKAKPKTVFDINYDDLAPRMAIILSIHALNLHGLVSNQKHGWQFEKDISIKNNR
jgi:hypothetical protein